MTDLAMDYLGLDALLSAEELAWRDTVRSFVRDRIKPNIKDWYENAVFPAEIVPEMGRLGLPGPEAGSDPASMTTTARRDGDGWVINGAKRWIGLASIADIAVI